MKVRRFRPHWLLPWVTGLLFTLGAVTSLAQRAPVTFEERVAAQRAIEFVYYQHLLWPEQNAEPKPLFSEYLFEEDLRRKVEDSLRMSAALDTLYADPITTVQLQAELDRMARDTKMPKRLKELWAALGDDPLLVAECLARPRLTEQRLRERYTWDASLHEGVRERARAELAKAQATGALCGLSGVRAQCLYLTSERMGNRSPGEGEMLLGDDAWQGLRARFSAGAFPSLAGRLGPLQESEEAFFAQTATEVQTGRLLVTTYSWPKRPFDAWWEDVALTFEKAYPGPAAYRLPDLSEQPADAHQSWSSISTTGAPSARRKHTAVWTGSGMVVWGGEDFSGVKTNTGGQYDPATDSWVATKTTGAPTARNQYRNGVWTNGYLVVWGETSDTTGGRYSPGSDSWYALSTTNAPTARSGHCAVWNPTMGRVVVWGGAVSGTETNTGKSLDPSSGTAWYNQAVTATLARKNHAAAYDSSVAGVGGVVLWGGSSIAFPGGLNSGATYSSGDGWAATTNSGAPSAREYATGVWRPGQSFIVWGGNSGTTALNDGGRWTPADVWSAISTSGAPAARTYHTALWASGQTGMVVWGGQNLAATNIFYADGALYAPAGNTWTALTATGAPSARSYHSAVYATGTHSDVMFIWGGTNGSAVTNTGGAYHFCRATAVPSTTGAISATDINPNGCTATGVQVTWPQEPTGGWGDDDFGPRSYTVFRDTTVVATLAYQATTVVDAGGEPNTTYTYTVRYTNGCGHTVTTAGVSAADMTDTTPCAGPGDTLRITKSATDALLAWGAVTCGDLTGYRVYGSATYGAAFPAAWTLLGSPVTTAATDLLSSSYLAYQVVSADTCGNLSPP